jgi:DeoR/GlpR family transcriptional regulator of sugar metabolism
LFVSGRESIKPNTSEPRALLADARRAAIVERLRTTGSVSVAELEEQFGVSSMTARRDLAGLERQGLVRRTHGGAVMPSISAHEDSFASRLAVAAEAKRALGAAAAAEVREGESLFLDSSTSAYHVARALVDRGVPVTVITNSLPVMELVATPPGRAVELVGVGGILRPLTRSFVGPFAVHTVLGHIADRLCFSVKGVTPDGALTDPDSLEAEVKRAMVAHSEHPILLLDESKLATHGRSVMGRLADVSTVLAHGLADDRVAELRAAGARVQLVEPGAPGSDAA